MAIYRYQVVSVGMWRGKIKRWNTTFHTTSSTSSTALRNSMNAVCYPNPGDTTGACSGGVASIAVYASTGGAPISQTTYFDWETPTTWIPFTGTAWSGIPAGTPIDASGESALILQSLRPGLSISGKPVYLRKYIHAIPSRTAADYADPDVPATALASLAAAIGSTWWYTPSGSLGGAVATLPFYGNHQRVRGRRRTTNQVATQSFSAGVVAGSTVQPQGAASPQ